MFGKLYLMHYKWFSFKKKKKKLGLIHFLPTRKSKIACMTEQISESAIFIRNYLQEVVLLTKNASPLLRCDL